MLGLRESSAYPDLLIADDPEVAQPFEQGIKLSLNPRIYRKDNIERTSPRGEQRLARYFGQGMGVGCEPLSITR